MNNLSTLFLNISKARQNSQNILIKMDRLARSSNVEDQKNAVRLGAELTRSLISEKHAIDAYQLALGKSLLSNLDPSRAMTLSAFNALSPKQRLVFSKSGGKLKN